MSFFQQLAQYALRLKNETPRPQVMAKARDFFSDTFACAAAGIHERAVRTAISYVESTAPANEAMLLFAPMYTSMENAAMINGIACHVSDYDDVLDSMNGHASAVILPAAIAAGEYMHSTGKDVLRAYIIGIEICGCIGRGLAAGNFQHGWHSTSTLGIFGAVATAAVLFGLSEEQLTYAFAIAASESSGIKGNFGTMTKSLHAGRAAAKGIFSARLAQCGYDANPEVMETSGGFAEVTTGSLDMDTMLMHMASHDSEFLNPGMVMKNYPSCKGTHNSIDAVRYIVERYDLHPEEISKIEMHVQPYIRDVLRYPDAQTPLQGKFSLNYCVALAAIRRNVTLADFEGDSIHDPMIQDMMARVEMVIDHSLANGSYMLARGDAEAFIHTTDGRTFRHRVNHSLGDPHNPMTREQMRSKNELCLKKAVQQDRVVETLDMLHRVDQLSDIAILTRFVGAAAKQASIVPQRSQASMR